MVAKLLEAFPWLEGGDESISGADNIDILVGLYTDLKKGL
jgi:hypothetical protein